MNDYSLAIVVGRLTRDPELKYTNPGGIPYLRMSLAVNRQVKKEGGEARKTVSFVEVSVWRRLAELCAQFLKKGRPVMVVGACASRAGSAGQERQVAGRGDGGPRAVPRSRAVGRRAGRPGEGGGRRGQGAGRRGRRGLVAP
jgi:single-strand DNA-binding protein